MLLCDFTLAALYLCSNLMLRADCKSKDSLGFTCATEESKKPLECYGFS